jgi:lysozyme
VSVPVTIADLAAPLIALSEGVRLEAYQDSGGIWTIGIGHTGPDVTRGLTISPELAWQLLADDQAKLLKLVEGKPVLEGAALVDFGFNCGIGSLLEVLLGRETINNPRFTHDRHGNVLGGLAARRRLESLLIQISREAVGGK